MCQIFSLKKIREGKNRNTSLDTKAGCSCTTSKINEGVLTQDLESVEVFNCSKAISKDESVCLVAISCPFNNIQCINKTVWKEDWQEV